MNCVRSLCCGCSYCTTNNGQGAEIPTTSSSQTGPLANIMDRRDHSRRHVNRDLSPAKEGVTRFFDARLKHPMRLRRSHSDGSLVRRVASHEMRQRGRSLEANRKAKEEEAGENQEPPIQPLEPISTVSSDKEKKRVTFKNNSEEKLGD